MKNEEDRKVVAGNVVKENESSAVTKPLFPSALSFTHRLFHPPKLERKHSSGDLHSRLKTRKILGVGETDNGDIHRSKISQLLGHNEHLYVKFPRGFRLWHLTLALLLTIQGFLALISPRFFHILFFDQMSIGTDAIHVTRLSGAPLIGLAIFEWGLQGTTEKAQARISLAAIITYLLIQLLVEGVCMWTEHKPFWSSPLVIVSYRILIVLVSLFYYYAIGSSTAGLRKSASYKDLVIASTTDIKSSVTSSMGNTCTHTEEKKEN